VAFNKLGLSDDPNGIISGVGSFVGPGNVGDGMGMSVGLMGGDVVDEGIICT